MRLRFLMVSGLTALTLGSTSAPAYFELELVSGGTMTADSYVEEDDAYRLYRPGGELRIEKDRVAAIHERDGRLSVPSAPRPAAAAPEPKPASPAKSAAIVPAAPLPEDTAALEAMERNLTRDIILGHREKLFAKNRGESPEELKRRKKELEALEKRREQVQTRLGSR